MGNEKSADKSASPQVANKGTSESNPAPIYVVVREGFRVSEHEYKNAEDPAAIAEQCFWAKIATTFSYGEPVEIVPYESKKHRIW